MREVEPPSLRLPQRPPRVLLLDEAPRPQRELEPRDEPEQRRDDGEDCAREKGPRETPGFSHVSRGPIRSGLGSTLGRLFGAALTRGTDGNLAPGPRHMLTWVGTDGGVGDEVRGGELGVYTY